MITASKESQHVHVDVATAAAKTMSLDLDLKILDEIEATKAGRKTSKSDIVKTAMSYMEASGAQQVLSKLVQQLMLKQPQDPFVFMMDFISSWKKETPEVSTAAPSPEVPADEKKGEDLASTTDSLPFELPVLDGYYSLAVEALKNHPDLVDNLRTSRTTRGVSFKDILRPALENKGHRMMKVAGLAAGDVECYSTFRPLFEEVLQLRYGDIVKNAVANDMQACPRASPLPRLIFSPSISSASDTAASLELRLSRNIAQFRFPTACGHDERREIERVLVDILEGLSADDPFLAGATYFPLAGSESYPARPGGMTLTEQVELEQARVLFYEPTSTIAISSGLARDYPDARGVFFGPGGSFYAWINEEDHIVLGLKQEGVDVDMALKKLMSLEAMLEAALRQHGLCFAKDDKWGYLTSTPSNVGTALFGSVTIPLPKASKQSDLRQRFRDLHLCANPSTSSGDAWVVSVNETFGMTPEKQLTTMLQGCQELLDYEAGLEA